LILEIIQVFTAIGGFATIDLICNTFGGLLGFLAFALVIHYLKQGSEKVQNTLVKSFVVVCYIFLTPVALYGVFNTLINLDFYISLYI
jgi:glycopeptide antibiotics resistance protein